MVSGYCRVNESEIRSIAFTRGHAAVTAPDNTPLTIIVARTLRIILHLTRITSSNLGKPHRELLEQFPPAFFGELVSVCQLYPSWEALEHGWDFPSQEMITRAIKMICRLANGDNFLYGQSANKCHPIVGEKKIAMVYCAEILVRYCSMLHGHHDWLFKFDHCLWNASLSHGKWGKTMN